MNLFAIVENDNETSVNRIPLAGSVQENLSEFFETKMKEFFEQKTIIDFDGNYSPDKDELFIINNYEIEGSVLESSLNPINFNVLNINKLDGKIKCLYAIITCNQPCILFQLFDTRKIISNQGFSLFFDNSVYRKFDEKGIVIKGQLTAVYKENSLYFDSYFNANRILNISDYYNEATAEDIDKFLDSEILNFLEKKTFKEKLNASLRKKIKGIQERDILKKTDSREILNMAAKFGINLKITNNKIDVPDDKQSIKTIIKFLDEDFFITPITKRKCITNSKRILKK